MAGTSIHGGQPPTHMSKHPVTLPPIQPRWNDGRTVIVAAPGPSLTQEVADCCRNLTTLAIKGAYQLFPNADVLYQCAPHWWRAQNGCPDFQGEKWSSHNDNGDFKLDIARDYGVKLVNGRRGLRFSLDPDHINYGNNSGFQGLNLTLLFGASKIILVGFDMCAGPSGRYFHGRHPTYGHQNAGFAGSLETFAIAARKLPLHIRIINSTPNSALTCFPMVDLNDALPNRP